MGASSARKLQPAAGPHSIRYAASFSTSSGELSLDDVKLINLETHNGMLARSHVGPDDLLTKIPGVGRMAVSSVPPASFVGDINQHLVRIKTKTCCGIAD